MPGLPSIYKSSQGQYTRSLTALGLAAVLAALSVWTFTLLKNYVETAEAESKDINKEDVLEMVFAEPWPKTGGAVYAKGDPVTPEAQQAMLNEGTTRWLLRSADPVPYGMHLRYGIPVLMCALGAYGIYRLVNMQRFADFLIATEGEMKKVSWSSRRELVGSTAVVLVTVMILAAFIYLIDMLWTHGFMWLQVLPAAE